MSSVHAQFQSFYDKYPHLKTKIQFSWGTKECREILAGSLLSDREGRAGFPPADAKVLFSILQKHDELFPQHNPVKPNDLPFKVYRPVSPPVYKPAPKGIDLIALVKVLIVIGTVIGLLKMMLK